MKRRTCLKTLTGLSVAGALPITLTPAALGATAERFLITVNATGGWDPTALIDPKGNAPRADGLGAVNNYSAAAIKSIGKLSYAPYPDMVEQPPADSAGHFDVFFNKHAEKIRVINGIDTQTNGHDSGRRFIWSGKLQEGYPTVAALAAATCLGRAGARLARDAPWVLPLVLVLVLVLAFGAGAAAGSRSMTAALLLFKNASSSSSSASPA